MKIGKGQIRILNTNLSPMTHSRVVSAIFTISNRETMEYIEDWVDRALSCFYRQHDKDDPPPGKVHDGLDVDELSAEELEKNFVNLVVGSVIG
ncbi:unnamed protein product [Caenorhabditis auriculariae]|uniref:Uncharacterized protein n=1 Tax=Caenorhabditis auriculariae TaxID=2777116 RepID=A0A8S1HC38_9PELO|nr:unnamed protein product [Caenorhabditis auriculariae]